MHRLIDALARALLALATLVVAAPALAQDYPTRPITVVVPFPPGASNDALARITRDSMSEILGQPVVIENRPGAGGSTGAGSVASAAPDGYTLLIAVNAPITMNSFLQKNFPFDPKTAFAPVAHAADTTLLLAVHESVPAKTVTELVDYAKKNPGKLSYGSAGVGSGHHITGELLKQKTGIDVTHIPYRGSGPAIQDLVAGHIPISLARRFGDPAAGGRRQDPHHRCRRRPALSGSALTFRPSPKPCRASRSRSLGLACWRRRNAEADRREASAAMAATVKKPGRRCRSSSRACWRSAGPEALDQKIKS
jgi:hypothetical protein